MITGYIRRHADANGIKVDRWVVEIVSGKAKVQTEISRLSRSITEIMGIMGDCFDDSINSKVLYLLLVWLRR